MSYPHENYYNDSYYNRSNHPHYYKNNRNKYNNYPHNKHYRGGYNKKNYNYDEGYSNSMPDFIKEFLTKYHSNNEEVEI